MPTRLAKRVLLIGWDAADWKLITPMMEAGQMPSLQRLVERGVRGNLATLDPPLSPLLWTSIATGKTADEHGVLGFVEPDDSGEAMRPVLGTSRRVKALWNILHQSGLRSNVVGWWPSHPAEPIRGAMVSNLYHRVGGPVARPHPMPEGAVHPPDLAGTMESLRIHPQEFTGNHLLPFVPLAAEIPEADQRLGHVARSLGEAATIHAAATWLLEHTEWDLTAVYYDALDHFAHAFMKYHPPQRPGISDVLFERYKGVVTASYRFHDMMLGGLLDLVDDDTTVLLLSDHGFHSDHLRPLQLPFEPAGPAAEHRSFGVLAMAGPGIRRDERVYGASLLDIAPTVLSLFGLPAGRDMPGRVLVNAFETPPEAGTIETWEDVPGDDGRHPPDARRDPLAEQDAMRQLVELGYIEPGHGAASVERDMRESRFYLGRVLMSRGKYEEARDVLQTIAEADPKATRYGLRLAECLRHLGQYEEAHRALDATVAAHKELLRDRLETLDAAIARTEQQITEADEGEAPQSPDQMRKARAFFSGLLENGSPGARYHRGLILLAEGKPDAAMQEFETATESVGGERFPVLSVRFGEALAQLRRWNDAERAFERALAVDPHLQAAHRGLAWVRVRTGRYEEAAASALDAIALQYHFPVAHFALGEALQALGDHARAAEAFEVALAQNPGLRRAHIHLAELYRVHLDDPVRATHHLKRGAETASG
ncbi:MAG: alkaline phosphatase family protein [Bacteroidota bacterium]